MSTLNSFILKMHSLKLLNSPLGKKLEPITSQESGITHQAVSADDEGKLSTDGLQQG